MGSEEEQVETKRTSKEEQEEEEEAFLYAMQLTSFSVRPMVLKSTIELDLLEIITKAGAKAQVSPSEIDLHLPTHNPDALVILDRNLRLLASYSCKIFIRS
ncbi:hypothetical protein NE237_016974 [Protea cynaroides]|uniref:O-methyltransferase dimerisation domain-containing protein n=1 Tax=Protea cynaroides TaxID=273540 RepID=A0A9Q0QM74_9MAGN|nr:hypothetical protein NE237_016974 [Protea cynaroides]